MTGKLSPYSADTMNTSADPINGVLFQDHGWKKLQQLLADPATGRCFILTDNNTRNHCLNPFYEHLEVSRQRFEVLEIPAGEAHKNLHSCLGLWESMSKLGADRSSVLINLGGGVVTDMGGFVASTYQRGIRFVNIPTTLLAMVDASIGGKNGVDLGTLKNQIGIIREPDFVILDPIFLNTLGKEQLLSGQAEMYKHGLISNQNYWEAVKGFDPSNKTESIQLIRDSVVIKAGIVEQDPREKGLRKSLNFGHTLGHAIESFCLEPDSKLLPLLHGEAIAIGMILEVFISMRKHGFPEIEGHQVIDHLVNTYPQRRFDRDDQLVITGLMKHDKKNKNGQVNFVLLSDFGQIEFDQQVEQELLDSAFEFYNNLISV